MCKLSYETIHISMFGCQKSGYGLDSKTLDFVMTCSPKNFRIIVNVSEADILFRIQSLMQFFRSRKWSIMGIVKRDFTAEQNDRF